MNVDKPKNTSSGCSHQTSARVVSPNDRRGSVTVGVPFIGRSLLQLEASLSSTLPSCPEHSRVPQIPPVSKYSRRYSSDNRCRNKQPSACCDRVRPFAFSIPEQKCGARRGR